MQGVPKGHEGLQVGRLVVVARGLYLARHLFTLYFMLFVSQFFNKIIHPCCCNTIICIRRKTHILIFCRIIKTTDTFETLSFSIKTQNYQNMSLGQELAHGK